MDKKKLKLYLEIVANLLMIIRNKDSKIRSLEIELRETKRLEGKVSNYFH
jgi:hypothetical protein